jgi:hypothetical protein
VLVVAETARDIHRTAGPKRPTNRRSPGL